MLLAVVCCTDHREEPLQEPKQGAEGDRDIPPLQGPGEHSPADGVLRGGRPVLRGV